MRRFALLAVLALALPLAACEDGGGGESCESICLDAQSQSCTYITDCYEFCGVSRSLGSKANCTGHYNDYLACARSTPSCQIDATCGVYEDNWADCVVPFCLANMSDPDCVTAANW